MLIAQTSDGVARVARDKLELLDHPSPLDDFIIEGRLAELKGLKTRRTIGWGETTLAPPMKRPGKIIDIGLNYRDHAAETGNPLPSFPRFHLIPGSAVTSSGATIRLPRSAPDEVDYEGELAIVVGRSGRDIPEKSAGDFVAGGTVVDDISARDIQSGENPGLPMSSPGLAKGFDGFKPLGPALLTADELRQYDTMGMTTEVNGVGRQRSSTAKLVFAVPQLPAFVSSYLTLEAGDVVLTGTPGGTGVADGRFLVPGDVIKVTVENIGTLTNTIALAAP